MHGDVALLLDLAAERALELAAHAALEWLVDLEGADGERLVEDVAEAAVGRRPARRLTGGAEVVERLEELGELGLDGAGVGAVGLRRGLEHIGALGVVVGLGDGVERDEHGARGAERCGVVVGVGAVSGGDSDRGAGGGSARGHGATALGKKAGVAGLEGGWAPWAAAMASLSRPSPPPPTV